jgi:hypothetical protein
MQNRKCKMENAKRRQSGEICASLKRAGIAGLGFVSLFAFILHFLFYIFYFALFTSPKPLLGFRLWLGFRRDFDSRCELKVESSLLWSGY